MSELTRILDAIDGTSVYCAYNANVDAIVRVDSGLGAVLPPPGDHVPDVLDSPADLTAAITRSMARGRGDEVSISTQVGEWLDETLTPDERRIGGQAGIMADVLSVVGASPILFTHLLSKTQRAMFRRPDEIRFPVADRALSLVPLTDLPDEERTKTNWVFEFETGATLYETTAVETTRFIAASRPDEFTLDVGEVSAYTHELGSRIDCAILSGFHSLKPVYGDGTTYRDQLASASEFVAELADETAVQIEYGVAHDAGIRNGIVTEIAPLVTVLSFDTEELGHLASDLGIDSEGDGIRNHVEALRAIRTELGIPAVKLHAKEYFLAVVDDYVDADSIRSGFQFAAVVAATKAKHGQIEDVSALEDGLAVDPSATGVEQAGLVQGAPDVVAVPNRVYTGHASTVGIGDTVSCASFVVEQALSAQ